MITVLASLVGELVFKAMFTTFACLLYKGTHINLSNIKPALNLTFVTAGQRSVHISVFGKHTLNAMQSSLS